MDHQRVTRERFFSSAEPGPPGSVSGAIATSWQRSQLSGVRPDVFAPPHAIPDAEQQHRLLRAVRPVLHRLGEQLSGCSTAVVVADARAQIIGRWVEDDQLERQLDTIMLATGFSYAEDHVGTNAIGTALEQGGSATVVGGEHFADVLQEMACAAALIHDPRTGRVLGVIDVTAMRRHFSPLMLVLGLQAVANVEQRLVDEASVDERVLLARFLQAARRTRRAVVSMNDRILIQNPAAAELLDATDHAVLRVEVRRALEAATAPDATLQIGHGGAITARLRPVVDGGQFVGELVMLDPQAPPRSSLRTRPGNLGAARSAPTHLPLLVGRSSAWAETVAKAAHHAQGRGRVLIEGRPGVGKLAVARAMHELRGGDGAFVVRDAADMSTDSVAAWTGHTAGVLAGPPATVTIRHLELFDATVAQMLAQAIDRMADQSEVWLAATITTGVLGARSPLLDRFPNTMVIPPLRQRADDVPALIEHLLGKRRCAPGVVSALVAQRWRGNVRELRELLHVLCMQRGGGAPIRLSDLPPEYRLRRPRGLTLLEQAEFSAIVDALSACRGNKLHAAKRLGISRSSLYRKMDAFEIHWARGFDEPLKPLSVSAR
jgi:sigma-54 dependent transcriptional regulator, acetoin dehydrogenase operon transcriptional activator AcoR